MTQGGTASFVEENQEVTAIEEVQVEIVDATRLVDDNRKRYLWEGFMVDSNTEPAPENAITSDVNWVTYGE